MFSQKTTMLRLVYLCTFLEVLRIGKQPHESLVSALESKNQKINSKMKRDRNSCSMS